MRTAHLILLRRHRAGGWVRHSDSNTRVWLWEDDIAPDDTDTIFEDQPTKEQRDVVFKGKNFGNYQSEAVAAARQDGRLPMPLPSTRKTIPKSAPRTHSLCGKRRRIARSRTGVGKGENRPRDRLEWSQVIPKVYQKLALESLQPATELRTMWRFWIVNDRDPSDPWRSRIVRPSWGRVPVVH